MKIETMEDLFLEQIEDLYDAEKPPGEGSAKNGRSRHFAVSPPSLESHLLETEGHVSRLENIFRHAGPRSQRPDLRRHEGADQ